MEEHLLQILGKRVNIKGWNRSIGELFLKSGSRIYVDGADDGALRIQGKNLRAAWCDEIGLWNKWDIAWNESLSFAVRLEPAQIVATGTPKMGHGLVGQLVDDETRHQDAHVHQLQPRQPPRARHQAAVRREQGNGPRAAGVGRRVDRGARGRRAQEGLVALLPSPAEGRVLRGVHGPPARSFSG